MRKKKVIKDKLAVERTELAEERTELAEKRTMLAYFRTGFAALLFGFGLAKVFEQRWIINVGLVSVALGIVLFVIGLFYLRKRHHFVNAS